MTRRAVVAHLTRWTTYVPPLAVVVLALTWGSKHLPAVVLVAVAALLAGAVVSAVHHAEVIAHKVGEPFGSLVLAVAVTAIEVGLIVMLMSSGGKDAETLVRDTVFAAVMVTLNGIVGLTLLVAGIKQGLSYFNAEGSGAAVSTALILGVMTLVLPAFTTSAPGLRYSGGQLAFASVMSIIVWGLFIVTQTVRHRDFFLPVDEHGDPLVLEHAAPPSTRETMLSVVLLLVALVSVVGLSKVESPALESGVAALDLPQSFVGVVIALLVLAPETLAATRNALRGRVQVALNLGFGSAIASIGLTIPSMALLSGILDLDLVLGLAPVHLVLLAITAVVSALTIVPGRATRMQGALHLSILMAYVFLSAVP